MGNFTQGPSGGTEGVPFTDHPKPDSRVIAVNVRAGTRIDSVQMILDTGKMPRHGGDGGVPDNFHLDDDEYITKIEGKYGRDLDSMTIHTNKRISPRYGGTGGDTTYTYQGSDKTRIVGFHGLSGKTVDAIGVVLDSGTEGY